MPKDLKTEFEIEPPREKKESKIQGPLDLEKPLQKEENIIKSGIHETSNLSKASPLSSFTTQPPISNPRGLLQCDFCAKHGRTMLFASKQDLDLHVKARHKADDVV